MNTETAMELQMRIAKEAVAMLVTRPTLDVQQYKESILLIGEAWGVSATDTLKPLDLIGQELLALQAMREGKNAEHVLPESELPMQATGTETLDIVPVFVDAKDAHIIAPLPEVDDLDEYSSCIKLKARIRPENTMETVEHSLIRMFREGPEVSLKGSPTVSPTTAALCWSEPLPP